MPSLIEGRAIVADRWTLLREATVLADIPAAVPVIVPLALWRAEREALAARGDVGVWLAPADDPAALAGDTDLLPLVAVDFPAFADGRGYSTARLLRERHGFRGQLRAIGDVLRDQLFALSEVGFDAFSLRDGKDPEAALASFADFGSVYAPTVGHPAPWFRRRHGGPSPGDVWQPER
jgi:uncharacterized protein (DUF934 family)